ncbi:MAG TPA: DUF2267 domain-containing protein [Syntrophales bacterium]|nr:DUF2267 domain-containing protein [Syntrophales bacterium]HPL63074.1 DUF2267 domain-containing protein [Syntrophales bacterium]
MKYGEFIDQIKQRGRFGSRKTAESAARATLETLGRRLGQTGKKYIRYPLPATISSFFEEKKTENFGLEKFLKFVAEREGISLQEAEHYAGTVVTVLQEDADEQDMEDMLSSLTDDYRKFFQKSRTQSARV